jgi:hypothetical protein
MPCRVRIDCIIESENETQIKLEGRRDAIFFVTTPSSPSV